MKEKKLKKLLGVSMMTWLVVPLSMFVTGMLLGERVGLAATQASEQSRARTSEETILLERAKTYWEARFAQDMQKAFDFEDPIRQKRLTLIQYIRMVGEPGKVYGVEVKGVKIQGDQADVEVEMVSRPLMPPWNKEILKSTITDDWQKIDDIWYHVLDLHIIRAGKPRVVVEKGTIEYPPAERPANPAPAAAEAAPKP